MNTFTVHPTGDGWAVSLDGLPLAIQAQGGVTPKGSIRATVELWSRDEGDEPVLLFADEATLSKDKDRARLAAALSKAADTTVSAGALLALAEAIRRAPPRERSGDKPQQGQAIALVDPEPWPETVDGSVLLDELAATFRRFVALPQHADTALALWVLHTHAHDAAAVSPRLGLTSPTKRCGKTTVLTVLQRLVRRPLPSGNITAAALFRTVEKYRPTLLIDEADTFLREREELRGLLNAGHTPDTAYVIRTVGDEHEPRLFSVWAPVAVAMIGELPDTLADRSIEVRMRRREPDERVEQLRLDRLADLEPIRQRAARWAADHLDTLRAADPDVPDGLHDRAADNWRPLLAIADLCGGAWPERARAAARALSGSAVEDEDAGAMLLADLRAVFDTEGADELSTAAILERLHEMEDRPWGEWRRGNPLSKQGLARLLKRFGISPRRKMNWRGYTRQDFEEAWSRYVGGTQPSYRHDANGGKASGHFPNRHGDGGHDDYENAANASGARIYDGMTDAIPPADDEREVFVL